MNIKMLKRLLLTALVVSGYLMVAMEEQSMTRAEKLARIKANAAARRAAQGATTETIAPTLFIPFSQAIPSSSSSSSNPPSSSSSIRTLRPFPTMVPTISQTAGSSSSSSSQSSEEGRQSTMSRGQRASTQSALERQRQEKEDAELATRLAEEGSPMQLTESIAGPSNQTQLAECSICGDEKSLVKLHCNHEFCRECLQGMFDIAVREKNLDTFKCPECGVPMNEQDVRAIYSDLNAVQRKQKVALFDAVMNRKAIEGLPGFKNCPTADCPYGFINDTNSTETVTCPCCNAQYCGNCLKPPHPGMTCDEAKAQAEMTTEERETLAWKKAHTKKCPGCKTEIEKNEGCLHMTCRKPGCKKEFCWNCMRDWQGHAQYFNCDRPPLDDGNNANNNNSNNTRIYPNNRYWY